MILGASALQLPAILKSKELGLEVIAVDMDKSSIGFNYADISLIISTIDTERVLQAAKDYKIHGIMTLATDMPMQTVASVSSELEIPGISVDAAIKATNKLEMIKALKLKKVPTPWYIAINHPEDLINIQAVDKYPFIIKPVDSAGSKGVVLVKEKNKLEEVYLYSKSFSKSGHVIIQEFLAGHEVSVETMTIKGETEILAITDKLTTGAPHFVEMGHSQDSQLPNEIKAEIAKVAISAIDAIGIDIGPAHVEIMVTEEGPKIIELGARMGGDYITSHLVPLSTGIDMVSTTIKLLMGEKVEKKEKFTRGSAIRYLSAENGIIESILGIESAKKIPGIQEVIFNKNIGDEISDIESSKDRLGCIISQGKDALEAIKICDMALENIEIKRLKNSFLK